MDALLSPDAKAVLDDERALLDALHALLERLGTEPARLKQLADLIANLEALFLVVVVGEFNAGKSSLMNALFGEEIAEEGPIPTTAKITILRYGPEPLVRQLSEYLLEQRYPDDRLRYLNLVDTPGTNSIIQRHQEITADFIPRADLVLFVTSFDRPLSESERQFLSFMREAWGKRLIFALNKIDLGTENEVEQVVAYLKASIEEVMGFVPRVFPVSAELAFAAKTDGVPNDADDRWARSRFEPFERFLTEALAGPQQLALKLNAPLDSAESLLRTAGTALKARQKVLHEDEAHLKEVEDHFAQAEATLREGYRRYLTEVDNLILQMEQRGVRFLDDTIRVGKLKLLKDRDAFKEEFNRQVVRVNEQEIESRITDAVDWLLQHLLDLWNWTLRRFDTQLRTRVAERPAPQSEFQYNRAEVFESIRRQAERQITAYDPNEEARRILENARGAAALFLGTEGVAVGIGAVAAFVIATSALDVTGGFIAAGVLAAFGFIILPRQRRKATREFQERIETLRRDLEQALDAQFSREIDEAMQKIRTLIAPFSTFIDAERATLDEATQTHTALLDRIETLRTRIRKDFGAVRLDES